MSNMNKQPDRLFVSKDVEKFIENIESKKYLDLDKSTTSRMELFLFAMSLGFETSAPTSITPVAPGGYVLDQAIKSKDKSLMHALYIYSMDDEQSIDLAADKSIVYPMAQEYANTGFQIIEGYMNTKSESSVFWEIIKELDEQYEKIINSE